MVKKRNNEMLYRREAAERAFPWRVDIAMVDGWLKHDPHGMAAWCRLHAPLSESHLLSDGERYYFADEGDAQLFQFTWGGDVTAAGFADYRPDNLRRAPTFSKPPSECGGMPGKNDTSRNG